MYGHDGRDRLWMTETKGFWIILLAAAVSIAFALAHREGCGRAS